MKILLSTRIIIAIFTNIPLGPRRMLFRALFMLFYHVSPRHRFITLHNLTRSFPEKTSHEIRKIAKNVYRSLGTTAAEFFQIPSLAQNNNFESLIRTQGREHYEKALAKKKGIIFFTAHLGNWELMASYFGRHMQKGHIIYRSLDNPIMENLAAWERSYTGNVLIPTGGAIRKILEVLKKNGIIGILIDQNVSWREGVFVDFFGRPACTSTGLAELALTTDAALLPAFNHRLADGTYLFTILEEYQVVRSGDYERDIIENTRKITDIVEDMVRDYPDQWFWLHQRWKTKPVQALGRTRRLSFLESKLQGS
ncbi:MAG: lysophospholipid acyltransferase family protein [Deltaproteobacteria bacterium]|nr:lysophospholipid acyltransferase family protein [Deltaproteobacteria bacterium]